jgi:hypothetical protein
MLDGEAVSPPPNRQTTRRADGQRKRRHKGGATRRVAGQGKPGHRAGATKRATDSEAKPRPDTQQRSFVPEPVARPTRRRRGFKRGERVRVAGYHHPDGLVAVAGDGPYLPVVVASKRGPVVHWLPVLRLGRRATAGPLDGVLRRYMDSHAGKAAARRNAPRAPNRRDRKSGGPAANRSIRGLDGGGRHARARLIG